MVADLIPPSEISSELSRLWDSLEGTNKTRASLFNLIFFSRKTPRESYFREIAKNVLDKFPSRTLFITQAEEGDFLNSSVSVISAENGSSDIACDWIEIAVGGSFVERIPYVLLPHILPDLPIYVIWGEDPTKSIPLFESLKKLASRIIFDSESTENLCGFASTLLNLHGNSKLHIADLNFARMQSWRELLASTFYTQQRLTQLQKAVQIQINYNAKETAFTCHPHIQALYLQGWLASQLSWKCKQSHGENGHFRFQYEKEGSNVEIRLCPETQENIKAGTILSLDIETEDQNHFSFGCNLDMPHHVSMRFSTLEKCDIPLRYLFAKDQSGQSLVKEITHRGTSSHFLHLLDYLQGGPLA